MIYVLNILLLLGSLNINYEKVFDDDYKKAQLFMDDNKSLIEEVSLIFDTDPKVITSIIFPEAIRYSIIRDYLETTSLELMYVSTAEVDFSIGSFQIKPSFAERIEYYAKYEIGFIESELLQWFSYEEGMKDFQIRKERLKRLKTTEGQLYYINLFYRYIVNRDKDLLFSEKEYQIRFLSTAFNHNFEANKEEIEIFMGKSFFPWGKNNDKKKYNYADIAWYYFLHSKNYIE